MNKLKSFQGTITSNLQYHPQSLQAICQLPAAANAPFAISAKHTIQAWTRMPGRRVFNKQTRLWEKAAKQETLPVLQVKQANGLQAKPALV